ncbi:hypothetical protein C8Q76DRAFT_754467 [Earliella scabrosa]|nr:hypothetical protein C8Q76DRAFT_754467 [Earliella scabrosa]
MLRPLLLHVSALNEVEYTAYTASIRDILKLSDHHSLEYDKLFVGVRELQAWLRGRYPHLAPSTLDSILRLFSPDLGVQNVLSGSQFFAALRLFSHVLSGRDLDQGLVFVQVG